eukprot:TRINITY_DN4505_c0_g1_i2.p2 TRINITY_DN4505_c0_g1~~TRINITY_DN4505_c0_g1_i2.p2  ORF type:complete len:159 (+),score=33.61 TRINITY_DN4505_c0_g1_i2:343-819(+)
MQSGTIGGHHISPYDFSTRGSQFLHSGTNERRFTEQEHGQPSGDSIDFRHNHHLPHPINADMDEASHQSSSSQVHPNMGSRMQQPIEVSHVSASSHQLHIGHGSSSYSGSHSQSLLHHPQPYHRAAFIGTEREMFPLASSFGLGIGHGDSDDNDDIPE